MTNNASKQPHGTSLAIYVATPGVLIGAGMILSAWFVPGGISGWLCGQEVEFNRVIRAIFYQPRPGSDHLGSANVRLLGKAIAVFQLGRLIFFYLINLVIASLWIGPSIAIGRALRPKPPTHSYVRGNTGPNADTSTSVRKMLESRENSDLI